MHLMSTMLASRMTSRNSSREKARSSNDEMLETTTALISFFGLLARV
jgi:hypothetical protein